MQIAVPIFDNFVLLDAIGPYEVLSSMPGATVHFLAAERGPVESDKGMLSVIAEGRYEDVPEPEVLVVPGGIGTRALVTDERLLDWIRSVHSTSRYTTSVCTGSLLLAAAGLLQGTDAATHWLVRGQLAELGARPVPERVVERGKIITAAGVSAGIDMALRLVELLAGAELAQTIQLSIEYDPQPPFDAGSPEKAPAAVVARLRGEAEEPQSPAA